MNATLVCVYLSEITKAELELADLEAARGSALPDHLAAACSEALPGHWVMGSLTGGGGGSGRGPDRGRSERCSLTRN